MAEASERSFPLDIEHSGIQLALPLIAIASFIGLLWLLSNVLRGEENSCLNVMLAVAGALGLMAVSDSVLKRVWKSGRTLSLSEHRITVRDERAKGACEVTFDLRQRLNVLAWRFTIKRSSPRAPRGSVLLALQLLQDDESVALYTLVSAREFDEAVFAEFVQLKPRSSVIQEKLPLRELAQQRRLLQAEEQRWHEGAEMRRQDFILLLEKLKASHVEWLER
ncbi:MAG: hypothetical protein CUN49_00855 [Candidatus Thermofonsia Clade 1 bacterium]|jgi:hypothetical protein|uniref:Uncharacterized protein n=1 Tax=Candidatus Thermofonsia Clade 1 bacterium TaxID=2364210 RepID=A0A2M8PIG6_9CHLR|nr:MAG: hypothetical protein CUN49_00855 [Candidatus Thermofonsia Clade 1 bacterium]RMF53964.1 MAG: hypothetical protein D6749_00840 [Chloroflexota bacterium]